VGKVEEWLPGVFDQLAIPSEGVSVLAAHFGLRDEHTARHFQALPEAVDVQWLADLCKDRGITYVFAGHWHCLEMWDISGVHIRQLGALVPSGFDDGGCAGMGQVVYLSDEGFKVRGDYMPGPRFLTVGADRAEWAALTLTLGDMDKMRGCQVFLRVRAAHGDLADAIAWLGQLREAGRIYDGGVVDDAVEARQAARLAAAGARSQVTMQESLSAYVAEMPLDEGVPRDVVLTSATAYLGGAA
jgi:hypothetical protein